MSTFTPPAGDNDYTGQTFQDEYPVVIRTPDTTFRNGRCIGLAEWDETNTPWSTWHDSTGLIAKDSGARPRVIGTKFDMVGDGASFSENVADDWYLAGVEMTRVFDDAVENDYMNSGTVERSLFDGVHIFLSCRRGGTTVPDGTGHTVTVRDCLVRLRPQHQTYHPQTYGYDHHGPFFKWASDPSYGRPPELVIRNSVFCCGEDDVYGYGIDLAPPIAGATIDAENVLLLWTGPGDWPESELVNWRAYTRNLTVRNGTLADFAALADEWRATGAFTMPTLQLLPDAEMLLSRFLREQPEVAVLLSDTPDDPDTVRVYTVLPTDPVYPCVRVSRWSGAPDLERPLRIDTARIQIDVFGGPKALVHQIAETIRAVLAERMVGEHWTGVVTRVAFHALDSTPDGSFDPPKPRSRFDVTIGIRPL